MAANAPTPDSTPLPTGLSLDHTTNAAHSTATPEQEQDAVESIVPMMPIVLPLMGGVLMLLLAFIAVFMA